MRILIVDDSKVMRSMVARALRQAGFAGHSLDEAGDGEAALQLINSQCPELVLSDWNMPTMPGLQLLQQVRASGIKTPFVFITSEGTQEMKSLAIQEGAQGLITKPFTPEIFQSVLGDYIQ